MQITQIATTSLGVTALDYLDQDPLRADDIIVSCGRFSVPHCVPSPCRLTWTGICLSFRIRKMSRTTPK